MFFFGNVVITYASRMQYLCNTCALMFYFSVQAAMSHAVSHIMMNRQTVCFSILTRADLVRLRRRIQCHR